MKITLQSYSIHHTELLNKISKRAFDIYIYIYIYVYIMSQSSSRYDQHTCLFMRKSQIHNPSNYAIYMSDNY